MLSVGVSLPEWPNRKAWAYVTFKHKDTCKFLLQRTGNVAVIGDTTSVHMVDLNLLWTLGNFGDSKEVSHIVFLRTRFLGILTLSSCCSYGWVRRQR
eukprot:COSAG01_NODE_560_length_15462_cov_18.361192_8_plen_97_part_00